MYRFIRITYFTKPRFKSVQHHFVKSYSAAEHKQITRYGSFENVANKNKETYLDMIKIFINSESVHRRGTVEFIYSALKNMEKFGVQKDLEVYKSLIDVLPKGKMVARNMFQVEFMHYPKQQQCIIDLLEQMEDNGVMPDYEMEDLLSNIFGNRCFPLRKYWRMMYWMPKFKNLSPWPIPDLSSNDLFGIAKCAIERISSVDLQTKISIYHTIEIKDSVDDTWIISAQAPIQKQRLKTHNTDEPLYIEGPFRLWLKNCQVNYFILRDKCCSNISGDADSDDVSNIKIPFANAKIPSVKNGSMPSIHEQDDGTVLALCATGTSSKDSLLSWVRHLQADGNINLIDIPIVFTLRTVSRDIVPSDSVPTLPTKQPT